MDEKRGKVTWIRSKRHMVGLSQRELADQIGVSRNRLNQWENGKAVPGKEHIRLLEEIFAGIEEKPVTNIPEEPAREIPEQKTKKKWYVLPLVIFVVLLCFGTVIITNRNHQVNADAVVSDSLVQQAESRLIQEEQVFTAEVEEESNMDALNEFLITELSELDGEWSVYVENLETGETIEIDSHMQKSASLIKLFTAGCYEQELTDNKLNSTNSSEYYEKYMISQSSNDAWEKLEKVIGHGVYRTGYTTVNTFAKEHGFQDTGRCMNEDGSWNGNAGMNWTSVHDVGEVLHEIYEKTYISKEASEKILGYMLDQLYVSKIPAGLPKGIKCANKTGELGMTQNDAAIVYGENTDYILVVMSDGIRSTKTAVDEIVKISGNVYEYLNVPEDQ